MQWRNPERLLQGESPLENNDSRTINFETHLAAVQQQRDQAMNQLAMYMALVQELEQENSRLKEQLAKE